MAKTPIRRSDLDRAVDTIIDYSGAKIPDIGNMTPQSAIDQIGFLKDLQKEAEKAENVLWQRLSVLQGGGHTVNSKGIPTPDPVEGDYYNYSVTESERDALNQGAAKEYFQEQGILADFMSTMVVAAKSVKRRSGT